MEPTRRTVLGAGLAALGLGAVGCAPRARTAAALTPASGSTAAGPASSSAAAARPLVVGAPARPLTRDPYLAWDTQSLRLTRQVVEPLLGVDPDTGAPVPRLAAEHTASEDGLTHTFTLAEGLVFEDGTACDAAAVVANITRWGAEGTADDAVASPFVAAFGGLAQDPDTAFRDVAALDGRTVRLRLRRPLRHVPAALSSPVFGISSPASWTRTPPEGGTWTPSGTGPYRWADAAETAAVLGDDEAADPAAVTVLVPSTRHRDRRPDLGPAVVREWGRAETRLRELRRGTADVIDVVAPGQLRPLVEAGTQVLPRDPLSVLYLGMNLDHPLLRLQHMREAVAYAVDRPRIASSDVFLQGTALAHDLVPPALGVADETARRYDVNPARARELLTLAGYDGEPLEFLYPAGASWPSLPEPERLHAMVSADLGTVGITVVPVPVPADQDYLQAVVSRPTRALHLMGRHGGYRDPHAFLEPFARSARAETGYTNAGVTRALDAAAAEADDDARTELFRSVVRAMCLDLPALPLVYPISALAAGPRVASYPTSPLLDEPFAEISIAQG